MHNAPPAAQPPAAHAPQLEAAFAAVQKLASVSAGELGAVELARLRALFGTCDTEGSGFITDGELGLLCRCLGNEAQAQQLLWRMGFHGHALGAAAGGGGGGGGGGGVPGTAADMKLRQEQQQQALLEQQQQIRISFAQVRA